MTVGPDCANAVDHSMEDVAHAYGQRTSLYDAFIEWQGLLRVKRFLRSYSSTFSQVLAVHRADEMCSTLYKNFMLATNWLAVLLA